MYCMEISSGALTIAAPLQVDHKDFSSTFFKGYVFEEPSKVPKQNT